MTDLPKRTIRARATGQPAEQDGLVTPPSPRGVQTLAALGLVIVAVGGVGALIFDVVIYGTDSAALVSLVSIALGGVIALAGAASADKSAKREDDPNPKSPSRPAWGGTLFST